MANDPLARNTFLSQDSYRWGGLFGTHFWVDPKERVVGILMAQTSPQGVREDFENAVLQAIVTRGMSLTQSTRSITRG